MLGIRCMWKNLLTLSSDGSKVIAKLPSGVVPKSELNLNSIVDELVSLDAGNFYLDEEAVGLFIKSVKSAGKDAQSGVCVAEKRNATIELDIDDQAMRASMIVTGAYAGRAVRGSELIHVLTEAHVTKGINKLALKKVMQISGTLAPGEMFTQLIAVGKPPLAGKNARFVPLVEDVTKRILVPKKYDNSTKVDMKNLGKTITVDAGEMLMKRIPATEGTPGYTVLGKILPPKPGTDALLKSGKGTSISEDDPNILIADYAGMPVIKERSVDVDNALCLQQVGVATGHIKFKGSLVITGNIEPGMIVRATGSITIGGFIESADVQAQGDILVGKGIIGHTVSEDQSRTCIVKSGGSIKANYAQYSDIQAAEDVHFAVHSLSNQIQCGKSLKVIDSKMEQGTLSGGKIKVGEKVTCFNLGVEGDTPTYVQVFARYQSLKERLQNQKEVYKVAQEGTMKAIHRELEFKKLPKEKRTDDESRAIALFKNQVSERLTKEKSLLDMMQRELDEQLAQNTIDVKNHVYTHVTIQFGDEKVLTKREHGASEFFFDGYTIESKAMLRDSDIAAE
jgi:uncharacterized protein (DUF342 family)